MTLIQEDILYEFLELCDEEFDVDEAVSYIKETDPSRSRRLPMEVDAFINNRKLAFNTGPGKWVSRRSFFQNLSFVICPSRLELLNGILIPGHRCVPFANSNLLPNEYVFFWEGIAIPFTSSEGPPEEYYPYYGLFGEEYAPQYVARDNAENEEAFLEDPYEDPPEVSIKTLDMRKIFMETSFLPGDRFLVSTLNWRRGKFLLKKIERNQWSQNELDDWFNAAEEGFQRSFQLLGPGSCTEDQLAYAYWYGSSRMRELPAYSLEEYLYEKSDKVETVPYGIETRFWFGGREIPDKKELDKENMRPDATPLELILHNMNIPLSEFAVQAYIRDGLYRDEPDETEIKNRIVPSSIILDQQDAKYLEEYIALVLHDFKKTYISQNDKESGPVRQRAGELHTAVIDLAARLKKGEIDSSWLPRHTFIILSQIQMHSAGVLEDLGGLEPSGPDELDALEGSLDSMLETYEDIKELINESINNYRWNNFSLVRSDTQIETVNLRLIQFSLGGVDVWRRVMVPENFTMEDLHKIIQELFEWKNTFPFRFSTEAGAVQKKDTAVPYLHMVRIDSMDESEFNLSNKIADILEANGSGIFYEYGTEWIVRIIIISRQESKGQKLVRCVAGMGAAPPEYVKGPLKFKRFLTALESGNDLERSNARQELGNAFVPGEFDMDMCNRRLKNVFHLV